MNISAVEIEAVLLADPGVAEAAVIGIAHPYWTEALVGVVVMKTVDKRRRAVAARTLQGVACEL